MVIRLLKQIFNPNFEPVPKPSKLKQWTKVHPTAHIGNDIEFGNWSEVGANSFVGDYVQFGNWTKVGEKCVIGPMTIFGAYTRVADGVTVPYGTVFGHCDLVTKSGIIPNRCSGSMMGITGTGDIQVETNFDKFIAPVGVFHGDLDVVQEALDIWMWGKTHDDPLLDLEQYRI